MSARTPPTFFAQRSQADGEPANLALVRRLLGLAWRYRWNCIWVILLQVLLLSMTLFGLGLTGLGIDFFRYQLDPGTPKPGWWLGIEPPDSWAPMTVVVMICLGILALAATRSVIAYLTTVSTNKLIHGKVVVELRRQVYDKLQRLSFHFFDANESGSIINRVTSDVVNTSAFLSGVLLGIINIAISLAVYVVLMVSIHVKLTMAVMLTMPVIVFISLIYSRMIRRDVKIFHERNDKMVLALSENVQGMHVVKGFARQEDQISQFTAANLAVRRQQHRIFWLLSLFQPTITMLTQVNTIIVLAYGGYLVVAYEGDPTHTVGMALGTGLWVFAGLTTQFSAQVQSVATLSTRSQECLASAGRVFEILDTPLDIESPPNAVSVPNQGGAVTFEAVTFGYKSGDAVLNDIEFYVEPGQCVAIVGPTGAGKSTLLSLLPRFYDPTFGRVLLDGVDVRRLDLDALRRSVGLVFQESFLFSNTIRANISFGHPHASLQQVENAARIACAHEFICELSHGYDTLIGERGADLSGGQRQRLAIARAILLEPSILVLDDPTAAIDPGTEREILAAMDNAMKNRTTFVVAHRLSTLRHADKVVVLDKGRVVQVGTHDELMHTQGHYRHAASLQVADEETKRLLGVTSEVTV